MILGEAAAYPDSYNKGQKGEQGFYLTVLLSLRCAI